MGKLSNGGNVEAMLGTGLGGNSPISYFITLCSDPTLLYLLTFTILIVKVKIVDNNIVKKQQQHSELS